MPRPRRHPDAQAERLVVYVHPSVAGEIRRLASASGVPAGSVIEAAFPVKAPPPAVPKTLPHRWKAAPSGIVVCERCKTPKNNPNRTEDCLVGD